MKVAETENHGTTECGSEPGGLKDTKLALSIYKGLKMMSSDLPKVTQSVGGSQDEDLNLLASRAVLFDHIPLGLYQQHQNCFRALHRHLTGEDILLSGIVQILSFL